MCACFYVLIQAAVMQTCGECRRVLLGLLASIQSRHLQFASMEVNLFSHAEEQIQQFLNPCPATLASARAYARAQKKLRALAALDKRHSVHGVLADTPVRIHRSNGSSHTASLFTRQGRKGINQDAMIVWEDFGGLENTIFCGVFDGHGPNGQLVSQNVRDCLPAMLLSSCKSFLMSLAQGSEHEIGGSGVISSGKYVTSSTRSSLKRANMFSCWKGSFLAASKRMDRKLLLGPSANHFCSGTTSVTIVKQGCHLVIGNVGDSRAVLGTKSDDNSIMAVQLTVDLKPSLPQEAERIKQCKGRVFATRDEPSVKRVWLPNVNFPGLAMARAFGDFCLKSFGVIAVPEVTYRRLTDKDQFIVLATDGVWDVLSNKEVVEVVSSVPARELAAKVIVDTAVDAWKIKFPTSKMDDCTVVCLYIDTMLSTYAEKLQSD